MNKKFLDFDKFMSEKNRDTVSVKVFGQEYFVPCEIPAITPVMMARAESSMDAALSAKMTFIAADAMFGKEVVDHLCKEGISARDLAELVQRTFAMINGSELDTDEEEYSDEESRRAVNAEKKA